MKRILSLLISAIMIISSMGITAVASDYDGHWAETAIDSLVSTGVVSGDASGSIRPDDNILRAEFVRVINKYFGYTTKASANFADVDESKWYADEFLVAKAAGYITGDSYGNANPEASITRAEVCVILSRLLTLENNYLVSFTDGHLIPEWAKGYIGAMYAKGLISGYTDGSFKAENNITRAESFSLITRVNKSEAISDASVKDPSEVIGNIGGLSSPLSGLNQNLGGGSTGGGGGGGGSQPTGSITPATFTFASFTPETGELKFEARFAQSFNLKVDILSAYVPVNSDDREPAKQYVFENIGYTTKSSDFYVLNIMSRLDEVVIARNRNNETYQISLEVETDYGRQGVDYTQFYNGVYTMNLPLPTELKSVASESNPNVYNVSWTAAEGASGYKWTVYNTETQEVVLTSPADITATSATIDLTSVGVVDHSKLAFVVQAKINSLYSGNSESKSLMLAAPTITRVEYDPSENAYRIYVSHVEDVNYTYRIGTTTVTPDRRGWFKIPDGIISETNMPAGFEVMAVTKDGISKSPYAVYEYDFSYAAGSGTENDPYYIANYFHFKNVSKNLAANYVQVADIDLQSDYAPSKDQFTGVYDGSKYTITFHTGTETNKAEFDGIEGFGLFYLPSGTIKNVITDGSIYLGNETYSAAIAAGKDLTATIENCINKASISHSGTVTGGIAARTSTRAKITNCINEGTISAATNAGGIVGWASSGTFTGCINKAEIKGTGNTGGIAGSVNTATFINCANIGNISGVNSGGIGGATGTGTSVTFQQCYNAGEVKSNGTVGAIFGGDAAKYSATIKITDCYNTGVLSGTAGTKEGIVGNLVNTGSSLIISNYYDVANSDAGVVGSAAVVAPTVEKVYILNATVTLPEGAKAVTADELTTALPDGFASAMWEVSTDEKYPYIQLISNKYIGAAVSGDGEGGGSEDGEGGSIPPTVSVTINGVTFNTDGESEATAFEITSGEDFAKIFGASNTADTAYITDGYFFKQKGEITVPTDYKPNTAAFSGTYDGQNNKINVTITSSTANTGIFGFVKNAVIKNVISDGSVTSTANFTGGIVGLINAGTLKLINCVNYAAVSGAQYTGGILGSSNVSSGANLYMEGCINHGPISASNSYTGGLVGHAVTAVIKNSANLGSVSGKAYYIGGIIGRINRGRASSWDEVDYSKATISGCYNSGELNGSSGLGGILGFGYHTGADVSLIDIENCYNTGLIVGTASGGVVGSAAGTVTVSGATADIIINITNFYDTANSGIGIIGTAAKQGTSKATVTRGYVLSGTNVTNGGTAATEGEIKALVNDADFNEDNVWEAGSDGYPRLKAISYGGDSGDGGSTPTPPEPTVSVTINGVTFNTDGESEAAAFEIASGEEFAKVFGSTNTTGTNYLTGKYYFKQTADITLPADYMPNTGEFSGSYNGNDKTININKTVTENKFALFTTLNGASISDLTLDGTIEGGAYAYIAAFGCNEAKGNSKFTNCVNSVDINSTGEYIAGFIACSGGQNTVFENCTNEGNITGISRIGGFTSRGTYTFNNCVNTGNITGSSANVGGFQGQAAGTYTNCVNKGTVIGGSTGVGGFVAATSGTTTFTNCANLGGVKSSGSSVGGFVGWIAGKNTVTVNNSYNSGDIEGSSNVAGLVGRAFYHNNDSAKEGGDVSVSDCYNTGVITATNGTARSAVGSVDDKCANKVARASEIKGFYDIANPTLDIVNMIDTDNTTLTVENAYVLDSEGLTYGTTITADDLKVLPSGFDSADWEVSTDGAYPYIQLKGNPYITTTVE